MTLILAMISTIGMMLHIAVDMGLLVMSVYVGAVDVWVCWKEDVKTSAVFRGLSRVGVRLG
jgi:hypothetical protein